MIVVTGSKGFIGSNLVKRLGDVIEIEIDDCFEKIKSLDWSKVSKIYHMGAISDTTERDVRKIQTYNINFSIQLFEKAIQHNIPVVYASSASVYGNMLNGEVNPLNFYSISKLTVDYYVQDNIDKFVNIVGLRFFNVYGDGEDHKGKQASPIHQFTKQAKETGTIKVFQGSQHFHRDFVWVEDVIDCMLKDMPCGIYDLGCSMTESFYDVARFVAKKYNAEIEEIPFPQHLKGKYQVYTFAEKVFDHRFTTVRGYLNV